MAVSDWSTTADDNTTIDGLDIDEDCSPANINNAIRSVMAGVKAKCNDLDTEDGKALKLAGGTMTGSIKSSVQPALCAENAADALRLCGSNNWNKGSRLALHPASSSGMVYLASIKTDGTDTFVNLELNADTGGLRWNGTSLIVKSATVYEKTVSLTQNASTTITITNPSDKAQHLAFIVRECWPGTTHNNAGVFIERIRSATQLDVVSHSATQNYSLKIEEIYLKKFA